MEAVKALSHKQLVRRAGHWLRNTAGCSVVVEELVANTRTGEIPDALGWVGGRCILIECKSSRSDFLADKAKVFRRSTDHALGSWRFYFAQPGIIKPDELPEGWGLYELRQVYRDVWRADHAGGTKYAKASPAPFESYAQAEVAILLSTLRRLELSRAVYIMAETEQPEAPHA